MKNKSTYLSLCCLIATILTFNEVNAQASLEHPAIIEFGWDYPDVNELYTKLNSMQNTPFDGICFSYQRRIMEAFDTMAYPTQQFEFEKLQQLKWGKYKHNYSILRGYSKTGGNWFDDNAWKNIAINMANLSKAIATGKLKGILFDAEYYLSNPLFNPWTYSKTQYPHHSFKEVEDKVRSRGVEFIKALQTHTANFSILSIWISSLLLEDAKLGEVADARHVMLLPFFEGILLAKKPSVKIIDGNEYAYWNIKPSQFFSSIAYLSSGTKKFIQSAKAKKISGDITISQPVYYDGIMGRHPDYDKGVAYTARWNWLEENLKLAMATSTSNTVWFYNERVDWWRSKVNDTLVQVLENSKAVFSKPYNASSASQQKKTNPSNVNSGSGTMYLLDHKKPMTSAGEAFIWSLSKNGKSIKVNYLSTLPDSVTLYVNGKIMYINKPKALKENYKLGATLKGKISLLAIYPNYKEAYATLIKR